MKSKKIVASLLTVLSLTACTPPNEEAKDDTYEPAFEIQDCDVKLGGIHFSKMTNNADKQVSQTDSVIRFVAPEGTDLFIDPNGKLTKSTAKILLTEIDNTKPFTFKGRLKPGFTEEGLYNAANLMVVANDTLWQKFCFEQDERGKHRVVTVRTVGTSDDNNHEVVEQDNIYYKISSDTHTIASYFSLDGKEWQMVRLYKNNYPAKLYLGICSQSPVKGECVSEFSELSLSTDNVGDFRLGD
jgi:regulation of enolase protein 1 (concanavalin A-like superfamily)